MKQANFTQPGGLPFDQDTLDFMQQSYYEVINALLSHFVVDTSQSYIISGCQVSGTNLTAGWMIIAGELLYFEGGEGDLNSNIAVDTVITPLTFQDGNIHDVYTFKKAVIADEGTALSDFISIPNANEFLTSVPQATETLKGIAEIATQSETNAGIDDTRMVTPKKVVQAINDLAPQPDDASETQKGIAEIATQAEANGSTDDSRIITPKKLHNRTATTTRRGVVELATTTEVITGTDNQRAVTPASLFGAGIKPIKITRGTTTTLNRATGHNQNNYNVNRAYVYPPAGYAMSHLRGFIASIAEIHLAGDVDGNDSFWCKYQIQSTRVVVIANNSENRANSKINYLAIWQK